jgi:hypothetical protein
MRRAFGYGCSAVLSGGKMAFLGCIFQRSVIEQILGRAGPAAVN